MSNTITIPGPIYKGLYQHLFQSDLEQGAFLFAEVDRSDQGLNLRVVDSYYVPARGWESQKDIYLQMKDSERTKIMLKARKENLCAIDCHSHPHADDDVWFSPSDIVGITEFAGYANWKLDGKPFAALVFGERSLDAVIWQNEFFRAESVDFVRIIAAPVVSITPQNSWFKKPRGMHRFFSYE